MKMYENQLAYEKATKKFENIEADKNFGIEEWSDETTQTPTVVRKVPEKIDPKLMEWEKTTRRETVSSTEPAKPLKIKTTWIKARKAQELKRVTTTAGNLQEYMDNYPIIKHPTK
jgi:hypothetical protein